MSVSCERETVDEGTGVGVKVPDLAVAFNKNVIRNNGETATLKAYYKGEDVTDEAYFFQFLPGKDVPQQMTTNVFSSTEVGEYHFQAAYLTSTSAMVSVNVVDREIPEPLKDESAGNTSFVRLLPRYDKTSQRDVGRRCRGYGSSCSFAYLWRW